MENRAGSDSTRRSRVPSAAEVVAALFNDMTFGRRRKRKPHGTPRPKSFRPKRQPRRGWQPETRI